ncbi:hypothetical protein KAI56_04850 [Candidatus Parcubacteria bacterium]|nr:hypothetical protein [Candidatus Parcubacteria bacterium]
MPKFERQNPQTDEKIEDLRERFTKGVRNEQKSVDGIKNLLKHFATEINTKYGPPDIVDKRGAIIGKEENEIVEELEFKFKDDNESFEDSRNRKENKHGIIFEMLITVIFNKILKEEFIIVHTSVEDDLTHHADNVIIEKKTGNVICTLDEANVDVESKRYYKKLDEIKKYNKKNGTTIEDGVKLNKENKLVETTIRNVPLFLLQISEKRLKEVLEKMDINLGKDGSEIGISEIELEVFDELIKSLVRQTDMLLNEKLPEKVKENIKRFSDSLEKIEKIRKGFDVDE